MHKVRPGYLEKVSNMETKQKTYSKHLETLMENGFQ